MREADGVPRTWPAQYAAWFGRVLQGDFGHSLRTGLPVLPELARVGTNTLYLTLGALLLTLAIAVPIAVHGAAHGDTPLNTAATVGAYILSARARVLVRLHRGVRLHPQVRHVPAPLRRGGEGSSTPGSMRWCRSSCSARRAARSPR